MSCYFMWILTLLAMARCNVLTFVFITSFGQYGLNTSGVVPAVDMAISDVNNRSDLLLGYTLAYDHVKDSQVRSAQRSGLCHTEVGNVQRACNAIQ